VLLSGLPRLIKRAFYVKPVVADALEGQSCDKQGGVFVQWTVWGGVEPAFVRAMKLAGWPDA